MDPVSYGGGSSPVGYGPGAPTSEDYPPNAQPGQCFAKVLVPEVTETFTEQLLVSPEKVITHVIPGDCGFEDKTVVVREPSSEFITVPATYRTVTDTVVVKQGGSHTETIPPVYETVTEQVMVREGYTVWRPGSTVAGYAGGVAYGGGRTQYMPPPPSVYAGTGATPNPAYGGFPTKVLATGEVLCLVAVPPEYKTITKQVLKVPGRVVDVPYPPETALVSRQVVDVPAHVEKREIPGETKILKIKVCRPDQTASETIPPEYKTVTKIRTITPSRFEWKTVDCKADVMHDVHDSYVAPPAAYSPPPVRTYAPPIEHHYHSLAHHVVRPAYAPPHRIYHPGKICHSTCDDGPAAAYIPSAPPVVSPPAYGAPISHYSAAATGGDRAVSNLQAALAGKGYYNGAQNGLFTRETMNAMLRYQHDNHLAEGRYTGETANSLGITR
jgi:hypothetical protein